MGFHFVANLRPQTFDSFAGSGFSPAAWLLSSHRLTAATKALALTVRAQDVPLMADNGTKNLIDHVVSQFTSRIRPITETIVSLRRQLPEGRTEPTASDVPRALQTRASDLAHEILDHVDDVLAPPTAPPRTGPCARARSQTDTAALRRRERPHPRSVHRGRPASRAAPHPHTHATAVPAAMAHVVRDPGQRAACCAPAMRGTTGRSTYRQDKYFKGPRRAHRPRTAPVGAGSAYRDHPTLNGEEPLMPPRYAGH